MSEKVCVLASGSNGNCVYISSGADSILIDCGISAKKAIERANSAGIDVSTIKGILITHEHSDHINGVGPLSRKFGIDVYCNQQTGKRAEPLVKNVPYKYFKNHNRFYIGSISITPFSISHDAIDPVGFLIEANGKRIGIATDLGVCDMRVKSYLRSCNCLVIESNHDERMLLTGPYPPSLKFRVRSNRGHLSNRDAAYLIEELYSNTLERVYLAHLSAENNTPDLAISTVRNHLGEGILSRLSVEMTYQDEASVVYC